MKEQILISIPQPCHEDWNKMTPVEQGRHCAVCARNVVDFTNNTDEDIIEFFKNYNGSTCGRFSDEQLNRPLTTYEIKSASRFLKYAAGLILPFTFFSLKSNAQKGKVAVTGDTTVTIPKLKTMPGSNSSSNPELNGKRIVISGAVSISGYKKSLKDFIFITGKVLDSEDGSPIAGATVSINMKQTVITSEDGSFVLQISKSQKQEILIITSIGYQKTELDISNKKVKNNLVQLSDIYLSRNIQGLSEVVVTGESYRRLGGLTGAVSIVSYSFRDSIVNFLKPHAIKAYPNPISNYGTLQLSFGTTKPGFYQIRLLNAAGQLFYSFQKQINSQNETEHIHLHERMSAGIYLLEITDEKKRLVQTSKIMVQ
ncbi:MAG TPA: carboxypeptidase-like regulatory domain-containing protein [Lacibacter sp.]|nr:carboxypeptidase-like regulatory domain-containing protein [Lacibacter sp.]